MAQVRNEDDVNDLRLTDQAVFAPELLDELLEPDHEACSSEGWISAVSAGNGHETKQDELKISDISKKTEQVYNVTKQFESNSHVNDENKEEMAIDNDKKDRNPENSSDSVGENSDDEKVDKDVEGEDEEYVVEKILDKRYNRRKKRIEYLIKWAGYDNESENTWESAENCKSAPDAIREYEESLKKNAKKYLLRNRPITEESVSNDDEEKPSRALKRKTSEINVEAHSEESNDDDSEEIQSKRTKVDCILGVKKEHNEILALVRFEDGHYDLISTRVLVNKCPKKLVNYYEKSLKFISS